MDIKIIKELITLVKDTGVGELEISEGEFKIRITDHGTHVFSPQVSSVQHVPHLVAAPSATTLSVAAPVEMPTEDSHLVKSPMVGTFYTSSNPEAPPFVTIGQTVKKGDPLCIIEAMKLMNEVEVDIDGVVFAILVENGHAVEYGQPLVAITPHKTATNS